MLNSRTNHLLIPALNRTRLALAFPFASLRLGFLICEIGCLSQHPHRTQVNQDPALTPTYSVTKHSRKDLAYPSPFWPGFPSPSPWPPCSSHTKLNAISGTCLALPQGLCTCCSPCLVGNQAIFHVSFPPLLQISSNVTSSERLPLMTLTKMAYLHFLAPLIALFLFFW